MEFEIGEFYAISLDLGLDVDADLDFSALTLSNSMDGDEWYISQDS